MQRHVRRFLAGFPRNDLRRLGSHLRSLLNRTIRHAAVSDREIFRQFFGYAVAVLSNGGLIFGNGMQSASVTRLSSYVNSELSRKVVVKNCL